MERGTPSSKQSLQTKSSPNPSQHVGSSSTNNQTQQNTNNVGVRIEQQPQNMVVQDGDPCITTTSLLRIMRRVLPPHGRISDDAKDAVKMCVNEFIGIITSVANERCKKECRQIVTADDLISAMDELGFDDYTETLTRYLQRYRDNAIESLIPRED